MNRANSNPPQRPGHAKGWIIAPLLAVPPAVPARLGAPLALIGKRRQVRLHLLVTEAQLLAVSVVERAGVDGALVYTRLRQRIIES